MPGKITEADLKLLATPDAEIIERSAEFCFDCDDFSAKIRTGERWQKLIQCHLYLEHVVDHLLRDAIPYPEEVLFSRMAFRQRLDLARALDLLPSDLVAAIRHITKMRNNVAHNLSFEIDDQKVKDLENCTPKHLRKAVLAGGNRKHGEIQLQELLEVILFMAEVIRHRHIADRLLARKSQIRLRTVLDKTPGAPYIK